MQTTQSTRYAMMDAKYSPRNRNCYERDKHNAEYLAMLDASHAQFQRGEVVVLSPEELKQMVLD